MKKGLYCPLEFIWKATEANEGIKSNEWNEQPSILKFTLWKYGDGKSRKPMGNNDVTKVFQQTRIRNVTKTIQM